MSIIIESEGFNNTLQPSETCPNFNGPAGNLSGNSTTNWQNIYLKDALQRISSMVSGLNITISDVFSMQQLCAYEVSRRFHNAATKNIDTNRTLEHCSRILFVL